jgi:hypothetical protein
VLFDSSIVSENWQNGSDHRDPAVDVVMANFRTTGSAVHPLVPRLVRGYRQTSQRTVDQVYRAAQRRAKQLNR